MRSLANGTVSRTRIDLGCFLDLSVLDLSNYNFEDYWLTVWNERSLFARQCSEKRQLHPLHHGLDASQGMAAQRNFVRGENQPEILFLLLALEFGEGELVERQQQTLFSGYFDSDRPSVRIARPTFGCFCVHAFLWVEGDDDAPT